MDTPNDKVNQQAWLSIKDIDLKNLPKKMAPRFIGLYSIEKIISPSAVRLRLPQSMRIHPTFPVCQIKPLPPALVHNQPAYLVSPISVPEDGAEVSNSW